MQTTSLYQRLATTLAVTTAILAIGSAGTARAGTFPPLNQPMTTLSHPGKFVWAELFTSDTAAAAKFYTGVLGWTAVTLDQNGVAYTVFSNGNHPVAGLRQRSSALKRSSRWINYIAVNDIAAALSLVTKAGGVVRAPARDFPDIGSEAIITDCEGSPVGLLQSDSGDSADNEPAAGDWNWFHLHVKNPQAAADFYRQVFNYDVTPDARMAGKKDELLLSSDAFNRAGISGMPKREDSLPGWLGVIRVSNLDATLARVPALDGEVIVAPHGSAFGSRFAVIADPSGGAVGLVEYLNNTNPVNHP